MLKMFWNIAQSAKWRKILIQETIRPVFDEQGSMVYFESGIEDITKRKDAESQLQDAKRVSRILPTVQNQNFWQI